MVQTLPSAEKAACYKCRGYTIMHENLRLMILALRCNRGVRYTHLVAAQSFRSQRLGPNALLLACSTYDAVRLVPLPVQQLRLTKLPPPTLVQQLQSQDSVRTAVHTIMTAWGEAGLVAALVLVVLSSADRMTQEYWELIRQSYRSWRRENIQSYSAVPTRIVCLFCCSCYLLQIVHQEL